MRSHGNATSSHGPDLLLSRIFAAPLVALLVGAAAPAQLGELDSAAERVRGHVEFLASDLLQGRETGSQGHAIAAAYVAAEFRKLGLAPGGDKASWYQQVPFRRATTVGVPAVSYVAGRGATALVSGRDFGLRPSLTQKLRSIDAPLVFAGHGISAPSLGIDSYAGLDVRGKIVVVLDGTPADLPSDIAAHLESMKDEVAAAKGAAGYIEIGRSRPLPGRPGGLERRTRPLVGWVDPAGRSGSSSAVAADLALSEEWAERLFVGAPRTLAQVRDEGARASVAGFALPGRLRISATSEWQDFTSPNVIGVIRGSDPALAAEHVVLMGHLDHLGTKPGAKPGEDAIYNGALDNAAGVATMIEAARSFAASGKRPRRSMLFIAVTGEEKGLLGAGYFAAHPTVAANRLVGLVNLDMPLLLYDFTDVIAFGAEHSTIAHTVAEAARSMGIAVSPDPMPEQSLFVRSDHYPLVKRGVPAVFLMTGYANGGKKAWDGFFETTYHRTSDEASQGINWRSGARFAELNYRIARALADAPARPLWYRGDYFGEAFAPAVPKAPRQRPSLDLKAARH